MKTSIIIFLILFISVVHINAQQSPPISTESPANTILTQQFYSAGSAISDPYLVGDYYVKLALSEFSGASNYLSHELLIRKARTVVPLPTTPAPSSGVTSTSTTATMTSPSSSPVPSGTFGRICASSNNIDTSSFSTALAVAGAMCRSVGFARGVFWVRNYDAPNFQPVTSSPSVVQTFYDNHPIQFQNLTCQQDAGDLSQCSLLPITLQSELQSCKRTLALNCTYGFSRGYEFRFTPSWRVEARYFKSWAYSYSSSSSGNQQQQQRLNYFGRICDDGWNNIDARAICRTMEFLWTENATFVSEATATSMIMYSDDDSSTMALDNVQCASYDYFPPYGNTFDVCSYTSTSYNCLARYESIAVDCLGNKHMPTNAPYTLPPSDGSTTNYGSSYDMSVKQESLLVFVCGSLFMVAAFFCCYKMVLKRRLERQAAIDAIREGRVHGITDSLHQMALLEAMFGRNNNNNREEYDDERAQFENPLLFGFSETQRVNNNNNNNQHNLIEMQTPPSFARRNNNNNIRDSRNENNNSTFNMLPQPHELDETATTARSSPTAFLRRNRALSLHALSQFLTVTPGNDNNEINNSTRRHRNHNDLINEQLPQLNLSPDQLLLHQQRHQQPGMFRMINGRPYQSIPLIAEARIATPTVGVITPRGGRSSQSNNMNSSSRQRSFSSPAAHVGSRERRGRHLQNTSNNNRSDESSEKTSSSSAMEEDAAFVLPPRGYDSSPSVVSSSTAGSPIIRKNEDDGGDQMLQRNHTSFPIAIPGNHHHHKVNQDDDDCDNYFDAGAEKEEVGVEQNEDISGVDNLMVLPRQQNQAATTENTPASDNRNNNNTDNNHQEPQNDTERTLDF